MRVVRPARISGQPCSWGSVGVPNLPTNHSATSGCAQASEAGISPKGILAVYQIFANCSLVERPLFAVRYSLFAQASPNLDVEALPSLTGLSALQSSQPSAYALG